MLLDNLITHLQDLKQITGGKIQVSVKLENEHCSIEEKNLTIIREGDQIHIRNF